jgi:hypothetical protein
LAVALRAFGALLSISGAWKIGTGIAAFLRPFGAAGSAASSVIGTTVTADCDVSAESAEGARDFFDDFLTARLRGDFGSIAILNSFSTNRIPVRISRGLTT